MRRYQGIIFDVDGTLVDSNDAHARAWTDALHEYGYEVSFAQVRKLIGMGSDHLLPAIINIEKESDQGQAIAQRRGQIFKAQYLPTVTALPGAHALVQRLHAAGIKLVVASSATKEELSALLRIAQVADLLPEQTSADDAQQSKPAPDIVLVALQRLGLAPEAAVMIGDTPYDIQSAQQAGVAMIALRCGGWQDAELLGALAIYDHPADLLAHYAESPLGATQEAPVHQSDQASAQEIAARQESAEELAADARAVGDQPV
jgi:HAD superfamily hydrolase (TIGR01509 family)